MTLFSLTPARLTDHRNPHGLVRVTCGGGLNTRPRFLSLVHESVQVSDDRLRSNGSVNERRLGFALVFHANQHGDETWKALSKRSGTVKQLTPAIFAEHSSETFGDVA